MNVVFVMDDPALEKEFLATCKANGMVGVKGHRSVGGFRVSLYNAMPLAERRGADGAYERFCTHKSIT